MQFNIVVVTNEPAVSLEALLGFDIIGTIPKAFRHGGSVWWMPSSCTGVRIRNAIDFCSAHIAYTASVVGADPVKEREIMLMAGQTVRLDSGWADRGRTYIFDIKVANATDPAAWMELVEDSAASVKRILTPVDDAASIAITPTKSDFGIRSLAGARWGLCTASQSINRHIRFLGGRDRTSSSPCTRTSGPLERPLQR